MTTVTVHLPGDLNGRLHAHQARARVRVQEEIDRTAVEVTRRIMTAARAVFTVTGMRAVRHCLEMQLQNQREVAEAYRQAGLKPTNEQLRYEVTL